MSPMYTTALPYSGRMDAMFGSVTRERKRTRSHSPKNTAIELILQSFFPVF